MKEWKAQKGKVDEQPLEPDPSEYKYHLSVPTREDIREHILKKRKNEVLRRVLREDVEI